MCIHGLLNVPSQHLLNLIRKVSCFINRYQFVKQAFPITTLLPANHHQPRPAYTISDEGVDQELKLPFHQNSLHQES